MNEELIRLFRKLNPWLALFEAKAVDLDAVPARILKECEDESLSERPNK